MANGFYTNFCQYRNQILVRGYENGKRFSRKVSYKPYLFTPSKTGDTRYRDIYGTPVDKIQFESMSEARDFVKRYEQVDNFQIYGLTNFPYVYIYDTYRNMEFDPSLIRVLNLDIEIDPEGGFPDDLIQKAEREVTAITMRHGDETFVLGCKPYVSKDPKVLYIQCSDERDLLRKFIRIWQQIDPDVITGWNVEMFDVVYLVNRITRLLGEEEAKRLSPWGVLTEHEIETHGKKHQAFVPMGIIILDYQHLYKKFSFKNQESFSLNHISHVELKEKKVDYSVYESLQRLYYENYELFIDYNIHDTTLVHKLELKLGFIQQVFAMAYDARVNYNDTMTTVRPWDVIVHNFLMNRCIVVHQMKPTNQIIDFVGGYVKEPIKGMHEWVCSFDLNSLYPHLIMQYNIGPDTFRGQLPGTRTIPEIMDGAFAAYDLSTDDIALAPNLCMYSRGKQSFLAEIMETMYNDRTLFKRKMIEAKKAKENETDPARIAELEIEIARCHNMQLAKKIQLNSAYGALGNRWFRWFDLKHAEAITMGGQLSIRWVERDINAFLNEAFGTERVDYVVAIDTDSVYVTLAKAVRMKWPNGAPTKEAAIDFVDDMCENVMQRVIDRSYEKLARYVNAYDQKMQMKRETIADRGVFVAKKKYVLNAWDVEGVRFHEPELKVTGIEVVRSSTPQVVRTALKDALRIMMNRSESDLHAHVASFREEFMKLPFHEVAFPRSVSDLGKYRDSRTVYRSGCPQNVKAALLYNKLIKDRGLEDKYPAINDGDKIKFTYLKQPNPIRDDVIAAPSMLPQALDLDRYIDRGMQFEKAFVDPIQKVLDSVGWRTERISTLEGLFG